MKLKDIYKLTLNRIGAREGDRQIENVVMAGINAGYKIIASASRKSKTMTIDTTAGFVKGQPFTLPNDFINLVFLMKDSIGRLSSNEYFIDSDILLITNTSLDQPFTMIYNAIPVDMDLTIDGENEPEIKSTYHSALSAYAAYYYYNLIGNLEAARMNLDEFNAITGLAQNTQSE